MPEGPEVEVIRRTLAPLIQSLRIDNVWQSDLKLRTSSSTSNPWHVISGQRVNSLERHGKQMWLAIENGPLVLMHFGMSGRVEVLARDSAVKKHTHIRMRFSEGQELRFVDPRRFGDVELLVDPQLMTKKLAKLGPDPLSWTRGQKSSLVKKLRSIHRPIKTALLDQRLLAGVGNIYASEALFKACISPFAQCCDIETSRLTALLGAVESVMKKAVVAGGTTFATFVNANGQEGKNWDHLLVFHKAGKPCPACQTPIAHATQSGRTTFYCPLCQGHSKP
jgi:formamidopyrimidine-DNA glycosylase